MNPEQKKFFTDLVQAYLRKKKEATDEHDAQYSLAYEKIRSCLGYFSALSADQFYRYLDKNYIANQKAEAYASYLLEDMAKTNHHFQFNAYFEVAKICAVSLLFVVGLGVMGAAGGLAIFLAAAGGGGGCMGVLWLISFAQVLAVASLGTMVTGLSGCSLFARVRKTGPNAEDILAFEQEDEQEDRSLVEGAPICNL